MTVAHITDHVEAGTDLLIEQYKGKPRLEALLASDLRQVQALEDGIWSVLTGRLIDLAVGVQLDALGRIVGQSRNGAPDEPFRARIRARIRANRSLGHPDDAIAVTRLALGHDEFSYSERGDASFVVSVSPAIDADMAEAIHELLTHAKALGVAMQLKFSAYATGETFAFASGDTPTTNASRGFAGDDPTVAPGGRWIDIL